MLETPVIPYPVEYAPEYGTALTHPHGSNAPGWVLPVVGEAGFYCVYDMVRKDIPRCIMKIFADRADAEKYLAVVKKRHPENSPMIACNF